jgi:hypothetical protein
MDQDTTRGKFGFEKSSTVLRIGNGCFSRNQMCSLRIDFDVSLVGIMNADNMLYHQILEHLKEVFK